MTKFELTQTKFLMY